MTRQIRYIIITASVVVALVAVLLLIKFLPSSKKTDTSSASSSSGITLTNIDSSKVSSIHVTNGSGNYTISKSGSDWTIASMASYPLSESYLTNIVTDTTALSATQVIDEDPTNLDQYGLTTPRSTIDIQTTDNKTTTLLVGNDSPTGSGTYLMVKGTNKVYLVSKTVGDDSVKSTMQLIDLTLTTVSAAKPALLTDIALGGSSRTAPLKMQIDPDSLKTLTESSSSSSDGQSQAANYDLISPSKYQIDSDKVSTIVNALPSMSAYEVVSLDTSDKSLNDYGLKNPAYSLSYTYDKKSATLLFGNTFQKDGNSYIYVMIQGVNVIYDIDLSTVSFYNWQIGDIMPSLIYTAQNIDTIKTITVTYGSNTWTYNLSGTSDSLKVTSGGKTLKTADFRNLYESMVYLIPQGVVDKSTSTVLMHIKVDFRDSGTASQYIEFRGMPDATNPSQLDAYKALCDANGETSDFYVKRTVVDSIAQYCQDILNGKTIPSPY